MGFFLLILMFGAIALPGPVFPQAEKHGDKERKEDAKRHRALAAVHEGAARCLEAGKSEKDCLDQLRKIAKGWESANIAA